MNNYTRIKARAMAIPIEEAKEYIYKLLNTAGQISWCFYKVVREELEKRDTQ